MDTYLKELFGNSSWPSVHIVDDNVTSALDCGGRALILHNHNNQRKSISGRNHNGSRQLRSRSDTSTSIRINGTSLACSTTHSTSATDHRRERWETSMPKDVGVTRTSQRSSDSAAGKPRRKLSVDEDIGAVDFREQLAVGAERLGGSSPASSSSLLENHWDMGSCSILPRAVSSIPPRLSRSLDDLPYPIGPEEVLSDQNTLQIMNDDAVGEPYFVALKSDPSEQTARRSFRVLVGPPKKPQRRNSDGSLTLVTALEAAVAASPLSSSCTSLDSGQDGKPEGIEDVLRQGKSWLRLPTTSLAAASHLDFP